MLLLYKNKKAQVFGIGQVGRSYQFTCKSPAEKKEWVEAIQKQKEGAPKGIVAQFLFMRFDLTFILSI